MNTHIEHIPVDPSEESDAGLWPLQVPDGFTVVSVEELREYKSRAKVTREDIEYPRDLFNALIRGNSPYAFYLFQWVPYQTDAKRWRLKMKHDVKTFDGREAFGIWPNGNSCGPFKDDEVEFIRISQDQFMATYVDPRS